MWTILSINNETHAVELCHPDGERMSLVVPQSATRTAADKMAHIKSQCDLRDAAKAKAVVDAKKEADRSAKLARRNPLIMKAIILSEAVAILILLLRH